MKTAKKQSVPNNNRDKNGADSLSLLFGFRIKASPAAAMKQNVVNLSLSSKRFVVFAIFPNHM